jgi:cytidylate kinase
VTEPGLVPVVAVDGPGGAGKGTICRALADELGWHLLDSGSLYRLVALDALERGLDLADESEIAELAGALDVRFEGEQILLRNREVSEAIRSEACSQGASRVAALAGVRQALVARQRRFRQPPGLVADGRDMGSSIFPDAALKVFLTASVEERARRRYKQLKDKGIGVSLSALSRDLAERDRRDAERAESPLRACSDARILDTTEMPIEAVIAQVLRWARDVYPDSGMKH